MDEGLLVLDGFNERERELFARSMNTLFSGGFILNQIEKDKPLYRFVLSHLQVFEAYLDFSGWSLRRDESLGVIALKGPALARFSLNLEETVGLLVLRVLYEENGSKSRSRGKRRCASPSSRADTRFFPAVFSTRPGS